MFDDLKKLDKKLNDSFKIDLFDEKDVKRSLNKKFPKPKAKYTKKNKPIMTKKDQEQAKQIIKSTGSAFGSLIKKIKNRKINKLEKEYFKTKEKSEQLAHEINLRTSIEDSKENISRYERELEKIKSPKEKEHSQTCKDYQSLDIANDCICGNSKE